MHSKSHTSCQNSQESVKYCTENVYKKPKAIHKHLSKSLNNFVTKPFAFKKIKKNLTDFCRIFSRKFKYPNSINKLANYINKSVIEL